MAGRNVLSGDYVGKPAVLELMGQVQTLTAGSFRPEVHDILASDDHVAALVTVHAERDGVAVEWRSVDAFHVRDGKLAEHWVHEVDQELVDRFWS
jgi:ketosteroid isomerase-like protein